MKKSKAFPGLIAKKVEVPNIPHNINKSRDSRCRGRLLASEPNKYPRSVHMPTSRESRKFRAIVHVRLCGLRKPKQTKVINPKKGLRKPIMEQIMTALISRRSLIDLLLCVFGRAQDFTFCKISPTRLACLA